MTNVSITHYLSRHESRLRAFVTAADIRAPRMRDAILYSLFPGGKRIRPLLVYLCGAWMTIPIETLDVIAAAIELIHCYSLVHDDLPAMDDDDFRRGKPSCHRAFDEATAILVGDGMQALALDLLFTHLSHSLSAKQVIAIAQELVQACGLSGMVSGQSLDLSELTNPNITEAHLRQIHQLKTGCLITACINMVLLAGEPSAEVVSALQTFAKHLGLVFQMQDDYMDRYQCASLLGKNRASDLANQKITFADLFSQDQLAVLITHYFQDAKKALLPFKEKAHDLWLLIDELYARMTPTDKKQNLA